MMREIEMEIESALEQQNPSHFEGHSIMERRKESASDFGVEHPALSEFARRMFDAPGQPGV